MILHRSYSSGGCCSDNYYKYGQVASILRQIVKIAADIYLVYLLLGVPIEQSLYNAMTTYHKNVLASYYKIRSRYFHTIDSSSKYFALASCADLHSRLRGTVP